MKEKDSGKTKIINKKRLLIVIVVFMLLAIMIFSNPDVQSFLFGREPIRISFQSGVDYEAFAYGREMLLVSNEGIRALTPKGEEAWSVVNTITSPMTVVKKDRIMVADAYGTTVNTYREAKRLFQIKTANEILTAKMNDDGYVAVATDELGYKGAVTVFDDDGKEVFKWYSGEGYIGDIDISSNGLLAVAQLMTDKEQVYSRIMLIDIENKKSPWCVGENDGVVMKLLFRDGNELLAVTDNGMSCYNDKKQEFYIDFQGRIPVGCDIENEDNMVFVFDGGLNNSVVESYSEDGGLRGKHEAESKINAFDVNGECILYATVGEVKRISPTGKVVREMTMVGDVKNMTIFSNRDKFIALGGSKAEIMDMD